VNSKEKRVEVRHISLTSFTIVIAMTLLSCTHKVSKIEPKPDNWREIVWNTGKQTFVVFQYMDSICLETHTYKYSHSKRNGYSNEVPLVLSDYEYVKMNKSERDSILNWTKKLIFEPVRPRFFVTDYVGQLNLKISTSHQVSQSCQYSSIGDWDKLSRETMEMKKLLCKKFKTVK
jgi:hypothetical protein